MQQGTDRSKYNLPVIDVQTERRNFPGYGEATYFTLADMQNGDSAGTTETDSVTLKSEGGYTTINNKNTKQRSRWNTKRS